MGARATFAADFTSFVDAVSEAKLSLRSMESDAQSVETRLNRVGNAFSGAKVLQDAQLAVKAVQELGGVSTLTEREQARLNATLTEALDKYRALGLEAPASMQQLADQTERSTGLMDLLGGAALRTAAALGVGFGAAELVRFTTDALEAGDALNQLSQNLEVPVERLQTLRTMASEANVPFDALTSSMLELGRRIGARDSGTLGALRDLGLEFEDIRSKPVDQQFEAVAEALGRVEDASARGAVSRDLFGKGWRDLIGFMRADFRQWADEADASTTKISQAQAEMLDKLNDDYGRVTQNIRTMWQQVVVSVAGVIQQIPAAMEEAGKAELALSAPPALIESWSQVNAQLVDVAPNIRAAGSEVLTQAEITANWARSLSDDYFRPLSQAIKDQIAQLKDYGASNQDIADHLGVTEGQLKRLEEEWHAVDAALAQHNALEKKLAEDGAAIHAKMMADNAAATSAAIKFAEARIDALNKEYLAILQIQQANNARFLDLTGQNPSRSGSRQQADQINASIDEQVRRLQNSPLAGSAGHGAEIDAAIGQLEQERAFRLSQLAIGGGSGGAVGSAAGGGSGFSGQSTGIPTGAGAIGVPSFYSSIPGISLSGPAPITVNVDAGGAFFNQPADLSRLADLVGSAVLQRMATTPR